MKCYQLKTGQTLIIREATAAKAGELITFIDRVAGESDFLTFGPGEFGVTLSDEEAVIETSARTDNQLFLIAEIDGKIVGNLKFTGGPRPRTRHTGEFGLSVLKDYWGLGIGQRLIECLIDWARAAKVIRKINLRVRADNTRAIALYTRLGFKREGILTRDFFIDGQFYDSIQMGMQID